MKVFKTGKIPVHVALTELSEEFEPLEIQKEINLTWVLYHEEKHRKMQEEIDLSWELYYAEEHRKSVEQKSDEVAELSWYDHEYMQNSTDTYTDDNYAIIKLRKSYACANRRRKTRRSKKRFRASVITASKNLKRFEDDDYSRVIRNRRIIYKPQKQHLKFVKLVKLAEKMKLVPIGELRK